MADLGAIAKSFGRGVNSARVGVAASSFRGAERSTSIWAHAHANAVVKSLPMAFKSVFTPSWWGSRPIGASPLPNFKIEGHVFQRDEAGDTPVNRAVVRLYQRSSGLFIGKAVTDETGKYRFDTLMPGTGAYFAVAFDPDAPPPQNALVLDRLSPEPV